MVNRLAFKITGFNCRGKNTETNGKQKQFETVYFLCET